MNRAIPLLAGILIAIGTLLSLAASWDQSLTFDENLHIGAGYSYLSEHRMILNLEHPPLFKDLAAIPLLFLDLKAPTITSETADQYAYARNLIYTLGNDADMIRHLSRIPMLLFYIISASLIFIWTRKLYGNIASTIAVFLFCFSPTILGHAPLVTSDLAAVCGTLIAFYFFDRYQTKPSRASYILAGLSLGVAFVSKFSLVLLIPAFFFIQCLYTKITVKKIVENIFSIVVLSLIGFVCIVVPLYFLNEPSVVWAISLFPLGLLEVKNTYSLGNYSYIAGNVYPKGVWYYFPIVFVLKESFAFLILILSSLFIALTPRVQLTKTEWGFCIWIFLYLCISMAGNLNIGIRHLAPIYPFVCMLISGMLIKMYVALSDRASKRFFATGISMLLIWYGYAAASAFPHYISYANHLAGTAKERFLYLGDSNIDWGQDLITLSEWIKKNNIAKIETDYFGTTDPRYYLQDAFRDLTPTTYTSAEDFIKNNHSDGWIAISSNNLTGLNRRLKTPGSGTGLISYPWLNGHTPVALIGGSIFVYHLEK